MTDLDVTISIRRDSDSEFKRIESKVSDALLRLCVDAINNNSMNSNYQYSWTSSLVQISVPKELLDEVLRKVNAILENSLRNYVITY